MTAKVSWDNSTQDVLCFDLVGEWDRDDMDGGLLAIQQKLSSVEHSVSLIINLQRTDCVPKGILSYSRQLLSLQHPNFSGHIVFVGCRQIFQTIDDILRRVYVNSVRHVTTHFADTLDSARDKLVNTLTPM